MLIFKYKFKNLFLKFAEKLHYPSEGFSAKAEVLFRRGTSLWFSYAEKDFSLTPERGLGKAPLKIPALKRGFR
jgi:hypothetical protein